MRHRDGSWRWLLSREVVFSRTDAGNPCQILGVAQDITERKQAEEAYRTLVDNSLQGLTIHQQGRCVFANAAAAQITGYPVAELLALSPAEAAATIHPDDRDMVMQRARERQTGVDVPQHYTFRILHKDGSVRRLEAFAIRVIYQGKPAAQMAYIDITERRQAEDALRASEARYRTLVEHFPDGVVFLFDRDLRYLVAGGQQLASVGMHPEMLEGKTLWEATPPDIAAIGEPLYRATLAGTAPKEVEQRYGDQIYRTQPVSLCNEQGEIVAGMIISQNITERKQAELQLQHANEQLHQANAWLRERNHEVLLLNQMSDLLQGCTGLAEAYEVIAGSAEKLFAGQAGALYLRRAGTRLFDSVAAWGTPAPAGSTLEQPDCQALQQQQVCRFTTSDGAMCRQVKDGDVAMVLCVPLLVRGETLGILQLWHTRPPDAEACRRRQQLADIVARQISLALTNLTLREQLQQQAIRDPLTGLYNRRYLDATLPRELQRADRHRHPIAVVMLDIDHFKRFNDTYGHDAGDTLLREVGSFLHAHTRDEDIACRYGGEEFTLVLPGASLEATLLRAETIRAAIQMLAVEHQGQPLAHITASLGVAVFPDHGTSTDLLIRTADQALYQAKRTGRDRVVVAEEAVAPDETMEKSP
ncbi:MAG: diguanylate cyclase [Chloroflexaceae bacterium]